MVRTSSLSESLASSLVLPPFTSSVLYAFDGLQYIGKVSNGGTTRGLRLATNAGKSGTGVWSSNVHDGTVSINPSMEGRKSSGLNTPSFSEGRVLQKAS